MTWHLITHLPPTPLLGYETSSYTIVKNKNKKGTSVLHIKR